MNRRSWLRAVALATLAPPRIAAAQQPATPYASVVARPLAFPRDHGSHPAFRTEWWYITGWTRDDAGVDRGVQITFFRTRPGVAEQVRSAFAPVQVLFAHAAIADPTVDRLRHDERAARAVLGLAHAAEATTDVGLGDWSLVLDGDTYRAVIPARDFVLDLAFTAPASVLLQGDAGVSRKGPQPAQASYYYSRPHLATRGTLRIAGRTLAVHGTAWLDHEWSSEYLAEQARGWDWTGISLDDGGALMAFRVRDANGAPFWAGATLQHADGTSAHFGPDGVRFDVLRRWRSPRTGIEFPVSMRVTVGDQAFELVPLMDDQELDARGSVGTIYWEGAITAQAQGRAQGRGYLELTGYGERLRL